MAGGAAGVLGAWRGVSLDVRETTGWEAAHRRAAGVPRPDRGPVRRGLLLSLDRGRLHRGRRQGALRPLHQGDRGAGVRRPDPQRAGAVGAGRHGPALLRHRGSHHASGNPLPAVRPDRLGGGGGLGRPVPDLAARRLPGAPRRPARPGPRRPGLDPRPAARRAARRAQRGRRRMTSAHAPVLLNEVVDALQPRAGQTVVDGTFGAGGYSRALLATGARVIAFDRDPTARRFAQGLPAERFRLVERRFSELDAETGEGAVDAVVFDIGVSSMQLDEAERGFSFMRDGPLDMRMAADGPTAADLVNEAEPAELARILFVYGEERESRRIARAIARRREEQPFTRTLELAEFIEKALGGRRGAKVHPATRSFQAIRIAVNEELSELEAGLAAAERALKTGGRLCVVTFHSLEDRIVKTFFAVRAGKTPAGSRHAPPVEAAAAPSFQLLFNGAQAPSAAELAANPRARSAKLRAAVRTDAPVWRAAA